MEKMEETTGYFQHSSDSRNALRDNYVSDAKLGPAEETVKNGRWKWMQIFNLRRLLRKPRKAPKCSDELLMCGSDGNVVRLHRVMSFRHLNEIFMKNAEVQSNSSNGFLDNLSELQQFHESSEDEEEYVWFSANVQDPMAEDNNGEIDGESTSPSAQPARRRPLIPIYKACCGGI